MKGIDVIEAFGGIDEELIVAARQQKKHAPVWLKWSSMAAVLLCAVILMAVVLARLLSGPQGTSPEPDLPDVLAPGVEQELEQEPEQEEPSITEEEMDGDEIWIVMQEELYGLRISVPKRYSADMLLDDTTLVSAPGEVYPFRFVDGLSRDMLHEWAGRVWHIEVSSIGEHPDETWEELGLGPSAYLLAQNEEYYFTLICPTDVQNQPDVEESANSYAAHWYIGYQILCDFLTRNDLEEHAGWKEYYQKEAAAKLRCAAEFWKNRTEVVGAVPEDVQNAFLDFISGDIFRWYRVQNSYSDHFLLMENADGTYWLRCYGAKDAEGLGEMEGFLYDHGEVKEMDAGEYTDSSEEQVVAHATGQTKEEIVSRDEEIPVTNDALPEQNEPVADSEQNSQLTMDIQTKLNSASDYVGVSAEVKKLFSDFIAASDWFAYNTIYVPYQTEWIFEYDDNGAISLKVKVYDTDTQSIDNVAYYLNTLFYDGSKIVDGLRSFAVPAATSGEEAEGKQPEETT